MSTPLPPQADITDPLACAVVLAAGQGTRMNSPLPKVLHQAAGRTLVDRVVSILKESGAVRIVVVVGFARDQVEAELALSHPDVGVAVQDEQLGTGHAVHCALPLLADERGPIGIFSGDTPLLRPGTVRALAAEHAGRGADATLLTAELADPAGYGRVIRDGDGLVARIVEEKDADRGQRRVREINAGAYIFQAESLRAALGELRSDNAQGEFYLTDTVAWLRTRDRPVAAVMVPGEADEVLGVNTPGQLIAAERILLDREGN